MRPFALTALLLLSLPAAAGTSLDKFDASAGEISVSDLSSLPLLRVGEDLRTFVRVKVSDTREALFVVAAGSQQVQVSADLAKELKLKVKSGNRKLLNLKGKDGKFKQGGEVKHSTLATLGLGGATLKDVGVVVSEELGEVKGLPIEGLLGLSTFRDALAWAILPGEGVLKVAPAAKGGALVSSVGEAVPYRSFPRERVKGKVRSYKLDTLTEAQTLVVPGSFGGVTTPISLETDTTTCRIATSIHLSGAPLQPSGDQPRVWTSASLPGLDPRATWWARDGGFDQVLVPHNASARTCTSVMFDVDLAIDPVAHTVALKRTTDPKRSDAQRELVEAAKKKASGEGAPKPEPEKKAKADAAPPKKDPAPLVALAAAQMGMGDYTGAIESWQAVIAIDGKTCEVWQSLGEAQLRADQAKEATASLVMASELYHGWWDLPQEERKAYAKKAGKLKTDAEKDAFGHKAQPASCYTVDSQLAQAYLARGDLDAVNRVFARRLDLDPDLALARGLSAIAGADNAAAPGPLREALRREAIGSPLASPRLALAVVNAQAGNWEAAAPLFQRALEIDDQDAMAVDLYLDALHSARGPAAALAAATAWADARPDSFAAQVGLLREAQRAEDSRVVDTATQRIEKLRTAALWRGKVSDQDAVLARYLSLIGRTEEAQKMAEEAISRDASNALAALVLAELAAAKGDSQKAGEWMDRAVRLGAMHPAYASLRSQRTPKNQGG